MKEAIKNIARHALKIIKLIILTILVLPSIFIVNNFKKDWEKLVSEFIKVPE